MLFAWYNRDGPPYFLVSAWSYATPGVPQGLVSFPH
jgi:hypothetical protein